MAILYIDCFSGISGDMFLGSMLDMGLPIEEINKLIDNLGLNNVEVSASKVLRQGLSGTLFNVVTTGTHEHRSFSEIEEMILKSPLPKEVKELSIKAFLLLAEAESLIHGIPLRDVHFHELGAIDSIVDIVGSMYGVYYFGVDRLYSSPIPLGRGMIESSHGKLPLPAPATLFLLRHVPVYGVEWEEELVTPTGAAILKVLAKSFGPIPSFYIKKIGYGAGVRNPQGRPNLLRVILGDALQVSPVDADVVAEIRVNLDDVYPYELGFLMERLYSHGALDVAFVPCYMKKNRPGIQVQVLALPQDLERISHILLNETPALGLRTAIYYRRILKRWEEEVATPLGKLRVKLAMDTRGRHRYSLEYDDIRAMAIETGLGLKEIRERLEHIVKQALREKGYKIDQD